MGLLLIPLILVLMYVVLIRPQQQRVRRQRELVMSIDVGDEVVTAGGVIGRVVELSDDRAWIEVADDVVIEMLRVAISRKLEERADQADATAEGEEGEEYEPEEGEPEPGSDKVEEEPHDQQSHDQHSDGGTH
jgi:preprotein translocase subunit YajC